VSSTDFQVADRKATCRTSSDGQRALHDVQASSHGKIDRRKTCDITSRIAVLPFGGSSAMPYDESRWMIRPAMVDRVTPLHRGHTTTNAMTCGYVKKGGEKK
jgi:hypothetical protein